MKQGRDAAQTTTSAIKDLILARGLHPGDLIPTEAELMEEFGVSRSNVREAVRTLVALDILCVRHGTGTFVGDLSMRPLVDAMVFRGIMQRDSDAGLLEEIVEVRRGLDLSLGARIVERLTGTDAVELQECVEEINACARRGENFADADRRFHLLLARELGNNVYSQLVTAFWDIHTAIGARFPKAGREEIKATADAHERMLESAVAGNLDAYLEAVRAHYDPILHVLAGCREAS